MSILRADVIEKLCYESVSKVTLQTFDNRISAGDLISLDVRLRGSSRCVPIKFVVCTNVSHDCLLSLADYRKLLDLKSSAVGSDLSENRCCDQLRLDVSNIITDESVDNSRLDDIVNDNGSDCASESDVVYHDESNDVLPLDEPREMISPDNSEVDKLVAEQIADNSLSGAFVLARAGKGGYFIHNGLLYHRSKIFGHNVDRLVVPECRRPALLDLAHSQVGCHMGIRKTKQRIAMSFTWPNLVKDVIDFCNCCEICQKRARITYRDRIPIEGGVVSTEPVFSHFYVDCLGPLFQTKVQYNYALVFLDKTSRFPHAVPLSSLSAKNCCEAMLEFWQFTGLPCKVSMDNASYFSGELTREFMNVLGVRRFFVHHVILKPIVLSELLVQ